jgi:hypothetical protein
MTNNYIKVTTRAMRSYEEIARLSPHALASSYPRQSSGNLPAKQSNLTWFFPVNDSDPVDVDAAIAKAGDLVSKCKEEFGRHFRGVALSVYRDFPGNSLPVVGRCE